jgi:23S rRNA (pseudouridine1915-N3)-methyltransferase
MQNIAILAVGKLKEAHWRDAQAEFLKRLTPFAKTEVIEVASSPFGATVTAAQSIKEEGERVLAAIPKDADLIALDRTGKEYPSPEFAALLDDLGSSGRKLAFVIGGAAGLDPRIVERARVRLSLSKMTFTHEMARVFLLEQLYRAATISAGKAYHL